MSNYTQIPYNRTIGRGLKILELISREGALTDHQISGRLGYNLITVQQLIVIYTEYGYITRDEKGRYDLGSKFLDMGRRFQQRQGVKKTARSHLKSLSLKYNETATLGTVEKTRLVYLDKIDSSALLRFVPQKEQKITAHHTALGKAILAHLPELEVARYCQEAPWHAITPKTIASRQELLSRLTQIRKQGFAICDEEYGIGIRSIASVILDRFNYPRYSIGIWGPVERMQPNVLRKMQADLAAASQIISRQIGTENSKAMMPARPLRTGKVPISSGMPTPRRIPKAEPRGFFQRAAALFL